VVPHLARLQSVPLREHDPRQAIRLALVASAEVQVFHVVAQVALMTEDLSTQVVAWSQLQARQ